MGKINEILETAIRGNKKNVKKYSISPEEADKHRIRIDNEDSSNDILNTKTIEDLLFDRIIVERTVPTNGSIRLGELDLKVDNDDMYILLDNGVIIRLESYTPFNNTKEGLYNIIEIISPYCKIDSIKDKRKYLIRHDDNIIKQITIIEYTDRTEIITLIGGK